VRHKLLLHKLAGFIASKNLCAFAGSVKSFKKRRNVLIWSQANLGLKKTIATRKKRAKIRLVGQGLVKKGKSMIPGHRAGKKKPFVNREHEFNLSWGNKSPDARERISC